MARDVGRTGKVLVAGTFDFLHPGHIHLFQAAREYGNNLVVVVAKDATVEKFKGRRPYFSEGERLELVQVIKGVDEAILGTGGDLYEIVRKVAPDTIVLGYDQWPDEREMAAKLVQIGLPMTKVVRALEKDPERFKSSKIREYLAK